jgi:hypothetical protein
VICGGGGPEKDTYEAETCTFPRNVSKLVEIYLFIFNISKNIYIYKVTED